MSSNWNRIWNFIILDKDNNRIGSAKIMFVKGQKFTGKVIVDNDKTIYSGTEEKYSKLIIAMDGAFDKYLDDNGYTSEEVV